MATAQLQNLVHHLRHLAHPAEATDRQLLERFAARRDEAAFATLVRRHGPLVLSVCQRILGEAHDAEDAFQATFLVLARKAAAVRWQASIGSWLYGVAWRVAHKKRVDTAQRRAHERQLASLPRPEPASEASLRELAALLDDELQALPDPYRTPLVLCYLEGRSRTEAARQLGWTLATLKRRLEQGRARLRSRLLRRGITLSAALLAAILARPTAAPAAALISATVDLALAFTTGTLAAPAAVLAEAVLRSSVAAHLKVWLPLLTLALLTAGAVVFTLPPAGDEPRAAEPASESPRPDPEPKPAVPEPLRLDALKASLLRRGGGNAQSEAAVAEGLKWLSEHQAPDGHWSLDGFHQDGHCNCTGTGQPNHAIAGTAFGLLPFLGAGITHQSPARVTPYGKNVELGLKYLVSQQKADGDYGQVMYAQALAALALCEAYGRSGDAALKEPAQRAIDFIVKAQHETGSWRYRPGQSGDTSVTSWQVQALHTARLAGLNVPEQTLAGVGRWLDFCQGLDGGYSYVGGPQGQSTPSMTAAGLLCRQYLGWEPGQPKMRLGLEIVKKMPPGDVNNRYYYHYATQVLFNVGGKDWEAWNGKMRSLLVARQDAGQDAQHAHQKGSWGPQGDLFGQVGGRVMTTSLALLELEVYYRSDLLLASRPAGAVRAEELPMLWADLGGDLFRARQVSWALIGSPGLAVPLLREKLQPVSITVDGARIDRLIGELDNDQFAVREAAGKELDRLGDVTGPALRKALTGQPSPELRRRVERLLEKLDEASLTPERLRARRGLDVLERIGTPEARQVVERLASGTAEAWLTREAKATLERFGKETP
jgi:RNA polymerase sigma factor (sigma-70 family)